MRFDLRVSMEPSQWKPVGALSLRGPMYQLSSLPWKNKTRAMNKFRCEERIKQSGGGHLSEAMYVLSVYRYVYDTRAVSLSFFSF